MRYNDTMRLSLRVWKFCKGDPRQGFTLVEIMIVVAIIGLLAAISVPAFAKARRRSQIGVLKNDLRIFVDAFQLYALEHQNQYPPDQEPGVFPTNMVGYLDEGTWVAGPVMGGEYEWHWCAGFSEFMIALHDAGDRALMQTIDTEIDDGNLATGNFIAYAGDYYYRFEQ